MSSIVRGGVFFCEGGPGSFDVLTYEHLVPIGWQAVPMAGKGGLVNFVRGRLGTDEPVGRVWAALRDRDFDFEPDAAAEVCGLRKQKWRVYSTHRTCIESYLIDPRVVRRHWADLHDRGLRSVPPSLAEMQDALRKVGRALEASQVFFWAEHALRKALMKSPWATPKLETLRQAPDGLAKLDAHALLAGLVRGAPTRRPTPTDAQVEAAVTAAQARFSAPAFRSGEDYLVWFHGKHLLDEARRTLKAWPLTKDDLTTIARDHVSVNDFADLAGFAATLRALPAHGQAPAA